jgi:hypothetical protein
VHLQADPVASAVDEPIAQTGVSDRDAGGGVDRARGGPRCDRCDCGFLSGFQYRVAVGDLGVCRLAQGVRAGAIGEVAVRSGAPDVDHHQVPGSHHPVGNVVVRAGPVGSRTDDDEGRRGVPFRDDRRGHIGTDLRLGPPNLQPLPHPGMHPVDSLPGSGQRGDLGGVLAHAQLR